MKINWWFFSKAERGERNSVGTYGTRIKLREWDEEYIVDADPEHFLAGLASSVQGRWVNLAIRHPFDLSLTLVDVELSPDEAEKVVEKLRSAIEEARKS